MESSAEPPRRDPWRPLRYLYRVPLLVLHVLAAIPLCSMLVLLSARGDPVARKGREPLAHKMTRWWASRLLRICGFRIRRVGTPQADPALFVCNHTSWLDIELLHTQRAVCFVAKAEIARWPLVGWMADTGGTIFHRRGNNSSLVAVMQEMTSRMRNGRSVAVFPEGGTSHGTGTRVFHARIFQAGLDAAVPIQPVALRYARNGKRWVDVAFRPDESFMTNVVRLLGSPGSDAEVHFLDVVPPNSDGRKRMAEIARGRIAVALADAPAEGRA